MLSQRVDLTENMDFSGGNINLMDTLIEIPYDEYKLMSPDEYERLIWWEGIFGRKRHPNQKREIFDKNGNYFKKMKTHCYRCGKEFRIPWDNIGGVCRKCDGSLTDSDHDSDRRMPWKERQGIIQSMGSVAYNLFRLK